MLHRSYKKCIAIMDRLVCAPFSIVTENPVVYFDVTIDRESTGRIEIELFSDVAPKTCENFRSLCTGERGTLKNTWKPGKSECQLHYKGVPFHRIIKNFIVQGGDILCHDGRGNSSIFGYTFFDESFNGKAGTHKAGTIAMAHDGPNRNGSQFFFNLKDNFYLNKRYVVFGQVVRGIHVLKKLNSIGTHCGVPLKRSWVAECGQSGTAENRPVALDRPDWYLQPPQHALQNVCSSSHDSVYIEKNVTET